MSHKNFKIEKDVDGIQLVTWDSPGKSMNVIDQSVLEEWEKIIDDVAGDASVKGVVLASGKKAFGAGADLSMLQMMMGQYEAQKATHPQKAAEELDAHAYRLNKLLRKQETCGKPFVAAINGQSTGRGLRDRACMPCPRDERGCKVGLPEVKVGLFPGGGGTQRLPRLIHTQEALQVSVAGQEHGCQQGPQVWRRG
ncbi:MAG: enoyl-CoA hydratase/isomerase family protein [Nitratireductor sp.]